MLSSRKEERELLQDKELLLFENNPEAVHSTSMQTSLA
jgi:hypothetical protein